MKKFLALLAILLATVIVIVFLFATVFINGTRVADYINDQLGPEYIVDMDEADFHLFSRSLVLQDVTIGNENGEEVFNTDQLQLKKIRIFNALRGRIAIESFELNDFYVNQKAMSSNDRETDDEGDGLHIRAGSIKALNGTVFFEDKQGNGGELSGINIEAGEFRTTENGDNDLPFELTDATLKIENLAFTFWDNRYQLDVQSMILSQPDETIGFEKLTLDSTMPVDDFFNTLEYRTDHFSVTINGFRIHEPDFFDIIKGESFKASYISVDSLDLHVTLDKRVAEDPDQYSMLPQEALEQLSYKADADSLVLDYATIRYSEIDEDGVRPGTITFADTRAIISPLSTTLDEPVLVAATSLLEGTGELQAAFQLYRDGDIAVTEISGMLGRFDVTRLNAIFEDLEGIHIESGIIHRADFNYTLRNRTGSGVFIVHYDDLSIDQIDMVDHDQDLADRIAGFFMDRVALRSSSEQDGENFREGEIDYENEDGSGFFNTVWVALRSGIMDVVRRI